MSMTEPNSRNFSSQLTKFKFEKTSNKMKQRHFRHESRVPITLGIQRCEYVIH